MLSLAIFALLLLFNASTAYTTGTMAILAVTAWKALPAINQILLAITQVRNSLPYIIGQIHYFDLIESDMARPTGQPAGGRPATTPTALKDRIQFDHVSFAYQGTDTPVLHDLCFEIKKGETVGIIGASGADKSTLVDLLIGLLHPNQGTIARALYDNPEVIIFDEATSSLDTRSEKAIQNTIYSFKGRQTLVVIAHRLSTVEDCDKIIWLDKGRIKMAGPPRDVLPLFTDQGDSNMSSTSCLT